MNRYTIAIAFGIAWLTATTIQVAILVIYFKSEHCLDETALCVYYPMITLMENLVPGKKGENYYAQLAVIGCCVITYSVLVGSIAVVITALLKREK